MSIVSAFNDIAVAQGGTADTSGTLVGAIDALNDALAGAPQEAAKTIEDAIKLLGENIGGGGTKQTIYIGVEVDTDPDQVINIISGDSFCVPGVEEAEIEGMPKTYVPDTSSEYVDKAEPGTVIFVDDGGIAEALTSLYPLMQRIEVAYFYGIPPSSWAGDASGLVAPISIIEQGIPVIDKPIFIDVLVITTNEA